MSEYALTEPAEADLFDIFLFGYEQFGARQAEIYAAELELLSGRSSAPDQLGTIRSFGL